MKAKRTSELERAAAERAKARSQQRLVQRIKRVANEMRQLGARMDYYGGFGEIGEHGREMLRAAACAKSWATALEQNPPNESSSPTAADGSGGAQPEESNGK